MIIICEEGNNPHFQTVLRFLRIIGIKYIAFDSMGIGLFHIRLREIRLNA